MDITQTYKVIEEEELFNLLNEFSALECEASFLLKLLCSVRNFRDSCNSHYCSPNQKILADRIEKLITINLFKILDLRTCL